MKKKTMNVLLLGLVCLGFFCTNLYSVSYAESSMVAKQIEIANTDADKWIAQAQESADRYLEGHNFEYVMDNLERAKKAKKNLNYQFVPASLQEEEANKIDAKISAAFQSILQKCESKLVGDISSVPPPKDVYGGKDKAAFKSALLKAWKEAYPEDVILGVRFPEAKWGREVKKVWEGDAWVKKDMSTLNAKMVVKITPQIAVIYHVLIYKNNISKTWKPAVYTKTDFVSKMMLVSKYK